MMREDEAKARLLEAALVHVPFDGWSELTFAAALRDSQVPPDLAERLFPRRAPDLLGWWFEKGDADMIRELAARGDEDGATGTPPLAERLAGAVMIRLGLADREVMRRAMANFALPGRTGLGARTLWATADAIWTALGDTADDADWHGKRLALAGVLWTTTLFWLGDESADAADTRSFLDRRLRGITRLERARACLSRGPFGRLMRRASDCGPGHRRRAARTEEAWERTRRLGA